MLCIIHSPYHVAQVKAGLTQAPLTPISQAIEDGVISRRELKALMRRSNGPALIHLIAFACTLGLTGYGISLAAGAVWIWPAMFIHGIVVVHLFSLQHECVHYTPFRTRWPTFSWPKVLSDHHTRGEENNPYRS